VKLGGRFFVDSDMFSENAASVAEFGPAKNTTYFRLARLAASGDMFDVFSYRFEMDFTGRDSQDATAHQFTTFKDVYAQMRDLPMLGTVTIGHFKEPFSLEEITSDSFTTFMERSLPNVFWPARNIGVAFQQVNEEETMTLAAGVFADVANEPPYFQDDNSGTAFTSRATWLPWYDEASDAGLLHLGLGYSYRVLEASPDQTLRQRSEVAVGPYMTAAKFTGCDHNNRLGPELAFMYGSFSLQSEWTGSWYARGGGEPDAFVSGYYVQAGYFLTGEHRNYKRSEAKWDRVKPLANFFRVRTADGVCETGKGAWEVAYRYSYLNLQDPSAVAVSGIDPAILTDHTFGLNWYLTPYSRLMFNYVHADRTVTGTAAIPMDVFEMRCQVDF
jgi:phosphate-selective porin OprO/OprP